jgi:hypothetical protein
MDDDGTAASNSNISKNPDGRLEDEMEVLPPEPPKKAPRKPRKPKEVVVKEPLAKETKEAVAIKGYDVKDSVFFPMLLATKRQLEKEARSARISNLRIV